MPPLISEKEMYAMSSGDEYDDKPISMKMLEYIRDGIQSHPRVNRIEAHYNICDGIKLSQAECKVALKAT